MMRMLNTADPTMVATPTQGRTILHFSAQLEPSLTHKTTLHTPDTPLNTGDTTPTRTPYRIDIAHAELRSERV